jgi:hypothetical protein
MNARRAVLLIAPLTLAVPATAEAVPYASQVVPGERVGVVKMGIRFFQVVYGRRGVEAVITSGSRFRYRGVRLGLRRTASLAARLRRRGFSPYDCRAANGTSGHTRRTVRYEYDFRRRRLSTLFVGFDVRPSCE